MCGDSSSEEYQRPVEDDGSGPISPLQLKKFLVTEIAYLTCKDFCKEWHYSKTCPPGKIYLGLYDGLNLIGIICYGTPAMRHQARCYSADIELRRLCCIDNTPKNTESFFISKSILFVKRLGFKKILSLSDPEFLHTGTVYRASNFKYEGTERGGGSRLISVDGVVIHSRTAFAKWGVSGLIGLRALFPEKRITVTKKKRKHVYTYEIDRRHNT